MLGRVGKERHLSTNNEIPEAPPEGLDSRRAVVSELQQELVATTPAGVSLVVFSRLAAEIAEIWKSGMPVTSRQLDLLAESHSRLVQDERAARLLMGVPG